MTTGQHNPNVLLTFDAAAGMLCGVIPGNKAFRMHAESGGGRGHIPVSRAKAAVYLHKQGELLASHYSNTSELKDTKGKYVTRGGTLPAGHYTCEYKLKSSVGEDVIQLFAHMDAKAIYSPFSAQKIPHGTFNHKTGAYDPRHGFYIHGSGEKGSDGCIVPRPPAERVRLSHAVRDYHGKVILVVSNVSYILPAELGGSAFA